MITIDGVVEYLRTIDRHDMAAVVELLAQNHARCCESRDGYRQTVEELRRLHTPQPTHPRSYRSAWE